MTDEPATTPAADESGWATPATDTRTTATGNTIDGPSAVAAADRVTALTLRCGQLREQRDEARRERDAAVARMFPVAQALINEQLATIRATEQRDEARREVERYSETIRAIGLRNMRLQREAREARAQAVQATTDADDLRARVGRLLALCDEWTSDESRIISADWWVAHIRNVLTGRAGTAPVSDSSASVDPSATPDPLGRNGSIQLAQAHRDLINEVNDLRANDEAVVAPWPPGVRKGDVLRAIGEGE